MIALAVLVVGTEGLLIILGQNTVPAFQVISYRTAKEAGWLLPLFTAVVVFAPISEEIMFRGFLYRGFVHKPRHEPYAIVVIITFIWMVIHQQYVTLDRDGADLRDWLAVGLGTVVDRIDWVDHAHAHGRQPVCHVGDRSLG